MTRSEDYEIVGSNLSYRRANLELIEGDLRRGFSQRLADDVRKHSRSAIAFRLLQRPAQICAVHSKRSLHGISLQQMLRDPIRHRLQISLEIEFFQRREVSAEVERVMDEVIK